MLRFPMLVTCIKTWDSPVSSHPLRGLAQGVDGTSFTGNQRRRTSAELLRHQRLAERGGKPRSIEPWGPRDAAWPVEVENRKAPTKRKPRR